MKLRTAHKRTPQQIEFDRAIIADWFLQSFSIRQITEKLNAENPYNLSHTQIANDIKAILNEWRGLKSAYIDERMEIDLLKVERLENEAWKAWERSKGQKIIKISSKTGEVKTRSIKKETQIGDPKFLDVILKCIQGRATLLGYMAPLKVDASVSVSLTNKISEMSGEEIQREIERLRLLNCSDN